MSLYFLHLRIVLSSVYNLCIPHIVPRTNWLTMALYTLGFRLNSAVVKTKVVSKWIDCVMKCATEICCRSNESISRKKLLQKAIKLWNATQRGLQYTSERLLEKNSSYNYVYLVKPQKVWLRRKNTCQLFNKQHMLSISRYRKERAKGLLLVTGKQK